VILSVIRPPDLLRRRARSSNIVTEGDDWEFDDNSYDICAGFVACPILLDIVSNATRVPAHVRAGFNSDITWDRAHLLAFDIPANAGRVQVDIDGSHVDMEIETENCFGTARGSALNCYTIYEVGSDGVVDPFNDPGLTGLLSFEFFDEDDFGLVPDDCLPQAAPPVSEAADLNIVGDADALLEFTAPPAGGSYVLAAGVEAHAKGRGQQCDSHERSDQTASSLPPGSAKWNRRPPGNA
jgi:hypothetical protein